MYDNWTSWTSDVRLSHTLYPVLNQFRSSQPLRHWLMTLLAILDAAALELTTLSEPCDRTAVARFLSKVPRPLARCGGLPIAATTRLTARPPISALDRRSHGRCQGSAPLSQR